MEDLILHISKEMFAPAAYRDYAGEYTVDVISNNVDTYSLQSPVRYNVKLTNTGDGFLLSGKCEANAITSCSRCLEDTKVQLSGEIDVFYIIDGEPDYENELLPSNHDMNLGKIIEAALLVDAPLIPLCSEDCKGLCPTCGKNLNVEKCDCKTEESGNAFAALKDFKVEDN